MERELFDWQHEYLATPKDYPISNNDRPATYDQFITLRDTLVVSNKYYADKAGRSLIIGTKLDWTPTDTIEIWEPNIFSQSFEPNGTASWTPLWKYVATWWHTSTNPKSCEIMKKWRYRLQHKEQFINIDSDITRIHSYILQHTSGWNAERAVFDWEWSDGWMFNRMTSFGYVECDLDVWDWLELKIQDQDNNDIPSSMLQSQSNWWMVEYIDLAYNI
jgi:hypothetical protein